MNTRAAKSPSLQVGASFSLVLGGPLFQLLRRGRLSDDALGLLRRRIVLAVAVTWIPLLILSAVDGSLLSGTRSVPFLNDIEVHLRFLLVVPLLIGAEVVVHERLQPLVEQFRIRDLIRPHQAASFEAAVSSALRLRNSTVAEVALVAFVYAVGVMVIWRKYIALQTGAWYAPGVGASPGLSLAGFWFVFVSLPILQFLLIRWYFRLLIWARFLWQVSRLDLDLNVAHPDKVGGLGFVGGSLDAFTPIAAAHGVLLAGMIANRIFYAGASLPDFKVEVFVVVIIVLAVFVGPTLVFAPLLSRVKREGLRAYGALGQTYVRTFRSKWLSGRARPGEPLVGSADIQSLADLGNSYSVAADMRLTAASRGAMIQFAFATAAPVLPLALTIMPIEKLIDAMVGLVL